MRLMQRGVVGVLIVVSLSVVVTSTAAAQKPPPLPPGPGINLGHIDVRTIPPQPPVFITAPPPDAPGVVRSEEVSLDEARAVAGFTIIEPAGIDDAGLTLAQVQVLRSFHPSVILVYRDQPVDVRVAGPREVVITEQRWEGIGPLFLPEPVEEGTIGGRPAVFGSLSFPAPGTRAGAVTRQSVTWEVGELLMRIDAAGLTRDELVNIAESLLAA